MTCRRRLWIAFGGGLLLSKWFCMDCFVEWHANGVRRNNDMTRWNIDNLMTHICAAALIVDNFEVDVNDLRDDLKLENKEYVYISLS